MAKVNRRLFTTPDLFSPSPLRKRGNGEFGGVLPFKLPLLGNFNKEQ